MKIELLKSLFIKQKMQYEPIKKEIIIEAPISVKEFIRFKHMIKVLNIKIDNIVVE